MNSKFNNLLIFHRARKMENQNNVESKIEKTIITSSGLKKEKIQVVVMAVAISVTISAMFFGILFWVMRGLEVKNNQGMAEKVNYSKPQEPMNSVKQKGLNETINPEVSSGNENVPKLDDNGCREVNLREFFPDMLLSTGWEWVGRNDGTDYPYAYGVWDGYMKVGGFYIQQDPRFPWELKVVYYYDKQGDKVNINDKEECSLSFFLEDAPIDLEEKLKTASKKNPVELEIKGINITIEGISATLTPAGKAYKEKIKHMQELINKDFEEQSKKSE